jgi:putative transposase
LSTKTKTAKSQAENHPVPPEAGNSFTIYLRSIVRQAAEEMMLEEVVRLCGERYRPEAEAEYRRAGNEMGVLRYDGNKEAILRPRVRTADGQREVPLESYQAMRSMSNHGSIIEKMVGEGLSCRGLSRATEGALGKSAIAEQWARKGAEQLEALRSTELSQRHWTVLMVDGLFLSAELCVIVAIGVDGVDGGGRKQVLDFESGASESALSAQRLFERLVTRGFQPPAGHRLLALSDGSKALQKAIKEQWPEALLQECLVPVERHVLDRLKRGDRAEAMRLFKRLRLAQGSEAALAADNELHGWLGKRHQGAQQSLTDAKERVFVVHEFELGEELQRALLSTNAIENVMRNLRAHGHGVKRWRTEGAMVSRWMASGLMWLQRGFHPLRGHQSMPKLIAALKHPEPASPKV